MAPSRSCAGSCAGQFAGMDLNQSTHCAKASILGFKHQTCRHEHTLSNARHTETSKLRMPCVKHLLKKSRSLQGESKQGHSLFCEARQRTVAGGMPGGACGLTASTSPDPLPHLRSIAAAAAHQTGRRPIAPRTRPVLSNKPPDPEDSKPHDLPSPKLTPKKRQVLKKKR
jgi:hypothetical protein